MPNIHKKFNDMLRYKIEQSETLSVKTLVENTGIPGRTWYNWISGDSTFPPDLIPLLYKITGDIDFLNFTLNSTDMMLTPRQVADGGKGLLEETLDASEALGHIVHEVREAMGDKKITPQEKKKILAAANVAHKEIEDIIRSLDA